MPRIESKSKPGAARDSAAAREEAQTRSELDRHHTAPTPSPDEAELLALMGITVPRDR
jgi:hypothetical protein